VPMHELIWQLLTSFLPLAILIMAVLGAILGGWATPSEAASLGAFFSIVLGGAYRMAALREGRVQELPSWVGKYGKPEGDWWTAFGAGALLVGAVYVLPYFTLRMFDETFTSIAAVLPADPALVGGPGVSVALALLAGVAIRLGKGRVDFLTRLYPTIPASRSLLHNVGIGALGGLVIGTLYVIIGKALEGAGVFGGMVLPGTRITITYFGFDIGFWVGFLLAVAYRTVHWETLRDSVYLTARTSAMVCWLFVGSWTFSSVFSYLGGHEVIAQFVLSLDLSFGGTVNPAVTFLIIAQIIIFLLGWPLEWSEIIIIFVPIFLPLLQPFHIDPLFFGILVALNLQTSFMTPPMAMAAYYLKGVAPPQVQLIEIFRGCMPFLVVVILSMVLLYNFQWLALWLPRVIYGG
jgi:TRAP-type C4-dicarboxylate transport system permease large subunit